MNISKKLDLWTTEKLISEPQKKAIIEFETKMRRPLFLYALLFLSSFCIGLGMIAVIASNWQIIPQHVKLVVDFILLAMLGGGIFYARINNKNFLMEALLILYAILILASIGLIAQVFQLPSHGYRAFLFWAVLVSPLMYFSKKALLSFIWLPVFTVSLYDLLYEFSWFSDIINRFDNMFPAALQFITILFFVSLYRMVFKKYFNMAPITNAFKYWAIILIASYVVMMDIFSMDVFHPYYRHWAGEESHTLYNLLLWVSLVALTGAFCWFNRRRQGHYWALALFILVDFSLIAKILPINREVFALWGAVLTLSMLSLVSVYGYKRNNIKLLNLASVLMALRFFIVYIQVFGSLLTTGLGLISSGLVFLIIAYIWQKLRTDVVAKIKEQK